MVRDPGLKSGTADFKSHSDHPVDLFQVLPGSTPLQRLCVAMTSLSPPSWYS